MELKEKCAKYVAFLRALYLLHQNHHWLTSGPNFYGNHLLFERIYKTAQEDADLAAEKLIGLFGQDHLVIQSHADLIKECLEQYSDSKDLVRNSLLAEKGFLEFSKEFYDELKGSTKEKLSMGLEDMLFAIGSNHETSVYLLKQVLGDDMNKLSALAKKLQVKLAQETTGLMQQQTNLADVGEKVKAELVSALGLNNVAPEDLAFRELSFKTGPDGKPFVSFNLAISQKLAPQVNAAVARNRQSAPNFLLSNYIKQLVMKNVPNASATGTVQLG